MRSIVICLHELVSIDKFITTISNKNYVLSPHQLCAFLHCFHINTHSTVNPQTSTCHGGNIRQFCQFFFAKKTRHAKNPIPSDATFKSDYSHAWKLWIHKRRRLLNADYSCEIIRNLANACVIFFGCANLLSRITFRFSLGRNFSRPTLGALGLAWRNVWCTQMVSCRSSTLRHTLAVGMLFHLLVWCAICMRIKFCRVCECIMRFML